MPECLIVALGKIAEIQVALIVDKQMIKNGETEQERDPLFSLTASCLWLPNRLMAHNSLCLPVA